MDTKPGYKTTEFWIAVPTAVVGLGMIAFGAYKGSETMMTVGMTLLSTASAGYGISRGLAK